MAWERSFEKKILKIRDKELKFQRLNYTIEVLRFISFIHFCLTKCSEIDFLEFCLVGVIDPTKLTFI